MLNANSSLIATAFIDTKGEDLYLQPVIQEKTFVELFLKNQ